MRRVSRTMAAETFDADFNAVYVTVLFITSGVAELSLSFWHDKTTKATSPAIHNKATILFIFFVLMKNLKIGISN
jgi:hypothetical protein